MNGIGQMKKNVDFVPVAIAAQLKLMYLCAFVGIVIRHLQVMTQLTS
jgi:hypothetical protein